jgi:tetratricopeptide (TPR) repeat protein
VAGAKEAPNTAEALRLVQIDPHRARQVATACLEHSQAAANPAGIAAAQRALGLAARQLGDVEGAIGLFRASIATAEGAGLAKPAAEARMSLSVALAFRGDLEQALSEADLAAGVLRGADAAALEMNRALVLQLLGRAQGALDGYRMVLAKFRRQGNALLEGRCRNNRGLLEWSLWDLKAAENDFKRAERLFLELGQDLAVADVRWNRGILAARRGDVPSALALLDVADEYYARHHIPRAYHLIDRCEVLLSVHLVAEGRHEAERAVEELSRAKRGLQLPEARLSLAFAALLDSDAATALANAEQARRAFVAQRRPSWEALARFAGIRAALLGSERTPAILSAARRTAQLLESLGWVIPSAEARVIAAQVALELGRPAIAASELTQVSRARRSGPVQLRIQAWHAEALLRSVRGDNRGADAALRAGLRILDGHRAALGATELRVHSSTHGTDLARFGLRLALESGEPGRVLAWAERWRAATLLLPPAREGEGAGAALRHDLTELRLVVAELEKVALEGKETTGLLRRQAALERAVRQRTRQAAGASAHDATVVKAAPLRAALGDAVLVELVEIDGELYAVTVRAGDVRLRALGPLAAVVHELDALRFALRRLARAGGSPERAAAAGTSAAFSGGRLDALLLGPLRPELGEGPLVMVPTGALHALPWGLLPTCRGRPVSVAPSATLWHRAQAREREARQAPDAARVVLVAGPGLAGAAAEVTSLRRRYPGAQIFTPRVATVETVLSALDGASLAHIAAHGRFRADNPLFSSLVLADGPLMVYDIERMRRAPRQIVLSACDSGVSGVRPGDELMGLAAALFAQKASTLVASVVPVSDEATRPLMLRYHKALQATGSPAVALARVGQAAVGDDSAAYAAAAAFVCFGAGW